MKGRTILKAVAAFTTVGGFLADWNKTHLFNPKWTPHAKFHDAMTISLAALLGGSSLYFLEQKDGNKKNLLFAALLPAFFWSAMAASYAFPGAEDLEAEFPEKIKKIGGIKLNEGAGSVFMLSLLAAGYFLAKNNK